MPGSGARFGIRAGTESCSAVLSSSQNHPGDPGKCVVVQKRRRSVPHALQSGVIANQRQEVPLEFSVNPLRKNAVDRGDLFVEYSAPPARSMDLAFHHLVIARQVRFRDYQNRQAHCGDFVEASRSCPGYDQIVRPYKFSML